MSYLYETAKDAVTGTYSYVQEKVMASKELFAGAVVGGLLLATEAQAATCSNTAAGGICTLLTASNIFTEMKDIATWISLGFIVFGFILFAGFKIYGVSKKS